MPTIGTSSIPIGRSNEELNVAHQRTAALLNQYFTRQNQVEQREKLLLEQQISSALGTSPLIQPILQQFQQQQQQQQALQLRQLNSALSTNTNDNLIMELLHQNNQDRQRVLSIQELQRLQPFLSTTHLAESTSTNQLQRQIQQLQQIEAQNNLLTLRMNMTERAGDSRELSSINPVQYDSASLLSNFDTMAQARIISNLQDIRQASLTSMAVDRMYRQHATRLLARNTSPISLQMTGGTIPFRDNDRKICAAASGNDEKKVIHRMGRVGKFPLKLHMLLNELKEQGRTDIAAFLPHGLAFSIFNTSEFAKNIMPQHFRMSRYSSFQRQLNLYDFQRITEGPDKGAYHVRTLKHVFDFSFLLTISHLLFYHFIFLCFQHRLFIEGQPDLLCGMKRNKIKGLVGKPQPNKLDHLAPTSNGTSAILTANRDPDCDEQDANETDDDSGIS